MSDPGQFLPGEPPVGPRERPWSAPPAAGEPVLYRPVSGLAIAGFILSGLFAAWVAIAGVVAYRAATPFVMEPASLVLPLAGFALSLGASIQIRRSEGTRAGLRLASCGMWLSALFGLGYGTYRGVTEYALRLQAKEFTNSWFELLRGNEVDAYTAFGDSLDPSLRDKRLDNPELRQKLKDDPEQWSKVQKDVHRRFFWGEGKGGTPEKGLLPRFFMHEVVESVRQAGAAAQVEAQGIRTWEHMGGSMPGYRVEQNYRIVTPDSELDVAVTVLGTDDETGRRNWRVLLAETGIRDQGRKWTPRGQAVAQLRLHSQRFADDWAKKLSQGHLNDAYLDTRLPQAQSALRLASLLISPTLLPGYAEFVQGGLLQAKGLVTPDPKSRPFVLEEVQALFQGAQPAGRAGVRVANPRLSGRYELDENTRELRFLHPVELQFGSDYRCEGMLLVSTRSPQALAAVAGLNGKPPEGPDALRLSGPERNISWWIAGLELDWAVAMPKMANRQGP
jgi:hypothetical protein